MNLIEENLIQVQISVHVNKTKWYGIEKTAAQTDIDMFCVAGTIQTMNGTKDQQTKIMRLHLW